MLKKLRALLLIPMLAMGCAGVACNTKVDPKQLELSMAQKRIYVVHIQGQVSQDWVKLADSILMVASGSPVIFHINSPGGGASESFLTAHGMEKLRTKYASKVYVYTDYGLYSGGYLVAVPMGFLIAAPSSMVGSIGVVMEVDIKAKADSMAGIKRILFRSGKMKWAESGYFNLNKEQMRIFQSGIDNYYSMFLSEITQFRLSPITVAMNSYKVTNIDSFLRENCDGREYTPKQALSLGLVDEIKYLDELITQIEYENYLQGAEIINIY